MALEDLKERVFEIAFVDHHARSYGTETHHCPRLEAALAGFRARHPEGVVVTVVNVDAQALSADPATGSPAS